MMSINVAISAFFNQISFFFIRRIFFFLFLPNWQITLLQSLDFADLQRQTCTQMCAYICIVYKDVCWEDGNNGTLMTPFYLKTLECPSLILVKGRLVL